MGKFSRRNLKAARVAGKELFDRALKLYDNNEFERAIEDFTKASQEGFRKDSVENNIGACFDRLGQMEKARAHYMTAVLENPRNVFALKNMAILLLAEGNWEGARKLFSRTLSLDPEDHEIRIGLARSLFRSNKIQRGVKILLPTIRGSSSSRLISVALHELSEAGAYDAILPLLQEIPAEIRESDEIIQILGETFLEMGMHQEAIENFKKLLDRTNDARSKSLLGLAFLASGDEGEGMRHLKEAEKEGKGELQVLQNFVFALHGSDRLDEALPVYRKILEINADDWVLWNNWGNALYNLGRYRESIPKFVIALEKNPDYEIAWNNIGNALMKMELYAEALWFHRRAVEIDWSFDYAHYAEAETLYMLGKYREAEEVIDRAISMNPICADFWMLKAMMAIHSSPDEALAYAEHVVETEPQSPEPLIVLAMCQEMIGQVEEAEKSLRMARGLASKDRGDKISRRIEEADKHGLTAIIKSRDRGKELFTEEELLARTSHLDSKSPTFWYKFGLWLLRAGKKKRAITAFRRALNIDPDSAATMAILLRLEEEEKTLREYLLNAKQITAKGVSIPQLEDAIVETAEKLKPKITSL